MSSKAKTTITEVQIGIGNEQEPKVLNKQDVILDYNKLIEGWGGVDVSDMMIYAYLDERRTVNYWK